MDEEKLDLGLDRIMAAKRKPKAPYRSLLEQGLFGKGGRFSKLPYEPKTISYSYSVNRQYTPDSVIPCKPPKVDSYLGYKDGQMLKEIWVEVKGRFRDRAEAQKYLHIRASHPYIKLVFVLQRANVPMVGSKKRKDGTRLTQEEWLTKKGFEVYYYNNINEFVRGIKGLVSPATLAKLK